MIFAESNWMKHARCGTGLIYMARDIWEVFDAKPRQDLFVHIKPIKSHRGRSWTSRAVRQWRPNDTNRLRRQTAHISSPASKGTVDINKPITEEIDLLRKLHRFLNNVGFYITVYIYPELKCAKPKANSLKWRIVKSNMSNLHWDRRSSPGD